MTRTNFNLILILLSTGCSPALQTLDPVTLQTGPREPSRVPEVERPAPVDFEKEEEPETADADGNATPATPSGLPPKRKVIESGGEDPADKLPVAEVARRERARRESAAPPIASIDNQNIEQRAAAAPPPIVETAAAGAAQGQATDPAESTAPLQGLASEAAAAREESERYWRERVGSLRYQWQELVVEEEFLESRVNELRRDYYQEDDGYYRDAEIKPEWDQAWEELQDTREQILRTIDELDRAMEDGRRAGALPGWMREGVDLEPERPSKSERERIGIADPVEPTTAAEAVEIDS